MTGLIEMPIGVGLLERGLAYTDPRTALPRPLGERVLFLINPSWRQRIVTVDFGAAFPGLNMSHFRFGVDLLETPIPTDAGPQAIALAPYEVRSYELS